MRTGLVVVGAALAVVGAAVIGAVLLPSDAPLVKRSGSVTVDNLDSGDSQTMALPASPSPSASLKLEWISTQPVEVSWFVAHECPSPPGWCTDGEPLATWGGSPTGIWTMSGSASSLYCIWVLDPNVNQSLNFTASFEEVYQPPTLPLPLIPLSLTIVGGSLLVGIGGVAAYLGLFLPSNVYGPGSAGTDDLDPYWDLDHPPEPPPPR